ncbi:hypothetical protein HZH68_010718 [Vespula germanica]|uniref:Uncharacterized protein n=1 Tax=Vespula germanica TaxID=30212 RepID=A0A834JVV4_VESGE|nr:hypothetical protein HZH68_010718 [Vespula germanica]
MNDWHRINSEMYDVKRSKKGRMLGNWGVRGCEVEGSRVEGSRSLREYKFSTSRVVGTVRCKFPRCRTSTIKKEEREGGGKVGGGEEGGRGREGGGEEGEGEGEGERGRGRRMEEKEEKKGFMRISPSCVRFLTFNCLRYYEDNGGKTSLEVLLQVVSSRPRDCGREPRFHPSRFMAPSSPHFHAAVTLGLLALPFP